MSRIPVSKPIIDEEMIEAASCALRDERIVGGESVIKFEEEFARYIGTEHAIAVSSGTDALILALIAAEIKGTNVITTPFTFIASANSIVHAGGKVVLSDVRQDSGNIDPVDIKRKIDDNTSAILPVHIFGNPCAMEEIQEIAQKKDLLVVEDACQAHGASVKSKKVGAIGDLGCFSFYPTKNMHVGGDGGMVTTDNDKLNKSIRKLRDCGRTERYLHDVHGFTSRLNSVNAAIGRVQLKRLDAWNESRIKAATRYQKRLSGLPGIQLPIFSDGISKPVFHLFAIQYEDRDGLCRHLDENGIDTAIHYPLPVHQQPAFDYYGFGRYPISEKLSKSIMSLPMFPGITDSEQKKICDCVEDYVNRR